MTSAAAQWYAAPVLTGHESRMVEHIKQWGFEAFCPMVVEKVRRGGKRITRSYPMFTGYIFLHLVEEIVGWMRRFEARRLRWEPIVVTMLGDDVGPVEMSDADMELVLACDGSMGPAPFKVGDRVRVESGPLRSELCYTVKETSPAHDRVWLDHGFYSVSVPIEAIMAV